MSRQYVADHLSIRMQQSGVSMCRVSCPRKTLLSHTSWVEYKSIDSQSWVTSKWIRLFYWHVYHLWSGPDVLYPFRFSFLHTPFITDSIIVKKHILVSSTLIHFPHHYCPNMFKSIMLSALPHMLVAFGTPDMTSCFLDMCLTCDQDMMFCILSDLFYFIHPLSPTALLSNNIPGLVSVMSSTHVGGLWYTWHECMIFLVLFSVTLLHSFISHIIISQTCSSVSCCQHYYMLVAFGTSDMTSCFLDMCITCDQDMMFCIFSDFFHCLHPLSPTAFSSKHISWSRFCHVNHTCWWTLVHLTWVQTFLVWFSVTLLHSFISHIVITQTCSSVLCCQHYHTCWWLLAHRTWHHVFSSFRFLVPLYTHS